jgi:predicted Zn finger-like uncharacterized protein
MGAFDSRSDPISRSVASNPGTNIPASCPTCHSPSITTTAKIPDSTSYWRCTKCGDVWNHSRRQVVRHGGYRWP